MRRKKMMALAQTTAFFFFFLISRDHRFCEHVEKENDAVSGDFG